MPEPLADRPLDEPHRSRRVSAEARAAHRAALARGEATYIDPESGLFVMTARMLADRGYCCGNRCRHCPYER